MSFRPFWVKTIIFNQIRFIGITFIQFNFKSKLDEKLGLKGFFFNFILIFFYRITTMSLDFNFKLRLGKKSDQENSKLIY